MSVDRFQQVGLLFEAVCTLAPADRDRYLDQACREDPELRHEVESLLAHDRQPHILLAGAQPGSSIRNEALAELEEQDASRLPATIGRYRVIRVLGQGGMGIVYLAEQENPRRTVALKVIRPSFSSSGAGALRRFEHEAQLLGRLQHPGIAQIFEAGFAEVTASDGSSPGAQPFFAMEFIDGRPLNEFADFHKLGSRRRLELFLKVCDAVHHAHLQGVIHRDLKPHNILVNAEGQPKVLDFGVARATDGDIQLTTVRTDIGQLVGTLPYMSPEQVSGSSQQLDLRSDVYALGVICYQLLTGQLPYDPAGRSVPEMVRIIADSEPPSLSSINRIFRGDLDTIVAKALEKDPARRYQSAAELAADVRRYLVDEPIVARAPSAMYQLRKFARRNKAIVAGVVIAFVALCGGTIVATYQAVKASRSALLAGQRLDEMREAREHEADAREIAVRKAEQADRTAAFLKNMIATADPSVVQATDVTVRAMLDRAAQTVASDLAEFPDVAAEVHQTIGIAYRGVADFERGRQHLQAAIELRRQGGEKAAEELATALSELGSLEEMCSDHRAAAPLLTESLGITTRLFGEGSVEAARRRIDLGRINTQMQDYAVAEPIIASAIEVLRRRLEPEDPALATALEALGELHVRAGDMVRAEQEHREALEIRRRRFGERHSEVAGSLHYLSNVVMQDRLRLDEAETLQRQAIDIMRHVHGKDHPNVAGALARLGTILSAKRDYAGALAAHQESLAINRAVYGEKNAGVAASLHNVAAVLSFTGDHVECERLLRETLDIYRDIDHPDRSDIAMSVSSLERALAAQGRYAEALPIAREALDTWRSIHHGPHLQTSKTLVDVAMAELGSGDAAAAEATFREAWTMQIELEGRDHFRTAIAESLLGRCLVSLKRYDEAEPLLLDAVNLLDRSLGPEENRTRGARRRLAELYDAWGKPEEAAKLRDSAGGSQPRP